jgi:hypothetical protein
VYSCSCESLKAADIISNIKMKKEFRPCFLPQRRKTGLLIRPPLWISERTGRRMLSHKSLSISRAGYSAHC